MIIPNTFKLNGFMAWVNMTEETYMNIITDTSITDGRIHWSNSYLLFVNDCFVSVNSKNIMIMFGQIIQKKYE